MDTAIRVIVALACFGLSVSADVVVIGGIPYTGATISDVSSGTITFVMGSTGVEVIKRFSDVQSIEVVGEPKLNQAEKDLAAGRYEAALAAYADLEKAAARPWLRTVARIRLVTCCQHAGEPARAIDLYFQLYDASKHNVTGLRLDRFGPPDSQVNKDALAKLRALAAASEGDRLAKVNEILAALKKADRKPEPSHPVDAPASPEASPAPADGGEPAATQPSDAATANPLALLEAALADLRGRSLPDLPVFSPAMTTLQTQEALQKREQVQRQRLQIIGQWLKAKPFLGEEVRWTLFARDVVADPAAAAEGGGDGGAADPPGYLLTATSEQGHLVTARCPASMKDQLLAVAKDQPLDIVGKILDYGWTPHPKPPATSSYRGRFGPPARAADEPKPPAWTDPAAPDDAGVDILSRNDLDFGVLLSCTAVAESKADGKVSFFGAAALANRVVYVVDRTGSMFDAFDYVRAALKESIGQLADRQEFHVILFSAGDPDESPPKMLVKATEQNKREAWTFYGKILPEGQGDPVKAMERAFAVTDREGKHAQLIYLLTDGEFKPDVIKRLRQLQGTMRTKIRINTLGFRYRSGEKVLTQIAEENGGKYLFVSTSMLGR